MKNRKNILNLFVLFLFAMTSCQEVQEDAPSFFYGNYNLEAVTMDQSIDINNDGTVSADFFLQLESLSGPQNNRMTFVEDIDDQMFFSFYAPTILTEQNGIPIVRFPAENVVLTVVFEESSDQFQIVEQLPNVTDFGEIESIELIDRLTLDVTLSKSLYDYSDNEWKDVMVNYRFVRGLIST